MKLHDHIGMILNFQKWLLLPCKLENS